MITLTTKNIKGDLFGGLTAGIVALPLALAFGIQAFGGVNDPAAASMGAIAGIIGASFLGFFASLFGGTHSQISGPTGPMTVISATLLSTAWVSSGHSLGTVVIAMSLSGLFCGLFQVLFGVMKIGRYVRYIPFSVLSGFMSGIGVLIILQQIYPLFGLKTPVLVTDMILQFVPAVRGGGSLVPAFLGIATVVIIYLFPRYSKKIPSTLVALVVMTIISLFLPLSESHIIGAIPSALPMPFFLRESMAGINWWELIEGTVVAGLTLAGLGSIDTLLTSVVADNITSTQHNSNQELIGQGIGNAMAGLFCGLPGAGATMRTVVNIHAGGRTQISGMVHAVLLLVIMLGLGPIVRYVPLSVLAGILITVGWAIIDVRSFRNIRHLPKSDALVMIVVFLTTIFVNLLTAVGIGVVMACVLFMKNISDVVDADYSSDRANYRAILWSDEETTDATLRQKVSILHLNGPLFFGSVASFNDYKRRLRGEAQVVILRMRLVTFLDQSGVQALETLLRECRRAGQRVFVTGIQPQPQQLLRQMNIIPNLIGDDSIFVSFDDCVAYLNKQLT